MTGNNWVNINCGFQGIDYYGSGIDLFPAWRVISHAISKVTFASVCAFVRFGIFTAAWYTYDCSALLPQLCLQNTMARAAIPLLFSLTFIIRPSHLTILLAIIHAVTNSSPPSSSASYTSCRIISYNFPLSVTWRAGRTI